MLVAGFGCNYLVRPLADKWFMKPEEVAALQAKQAAGTTTSGSFGIGKGGLEAKAALFWAFVGNPTGLGRVADAGERDEDFLNFGASGLAVLGAPIPFEIGDQRGTEMAIRLLARVHGHIVAKQVERLFPHAKSSPV